MSHLTVKLEYDRKVAELQEMVAKEAKKLQDTVDVRDAVILEMKQLSNHKTIMLRGIAGLDEEIKKKTNILNQLIVTEESYISSSKKELNKEKESLVNTKHQLSELTDKLSELNLVAKEINQFIELEADARNKYLEEKEKLEISKRTSKKISENVTKALEKADKKNRELDNYKQYIADLYGKLATYVRVARETVETANSYFKENGVPIEFGLPPGEIVKIDFDKFNIKNYE